MNQYHTFTKLLSFAFIISSATGSVAQFQTGTTHSKDALAKLYSQRKESKSCEPIAPIQTRLIAPNSVAAGSIANVRFEAMLMEFGTKGEYRLDLPKGVRLVSGKSAETGDIAAKTAYGWNFQLAFDRPGDYEVNAQLIAGDDTYRFGQRRTLYVHNTGSTVTLTTEKPKVKPILQTEPYPAVKGGENVLQFPRGIGAPPASGPFEEKTDPYGAPIDNIFRGGGNGIAATATVTGTWRYRHTDGTLHPGYGSWVEAWDDDPGGSDDFLGRDTADANGDFSITFDNADDIGFGTSDVYIVFKSENTRVEVHNSGATVGYSAATGVQFQNIGSGTFSVGSW